MNKVIYRLVFVLAFLLGALFYNFVKADCYSDGIRVGVVQKFSKKGTFAKSWEGELVMDGIKSKSSQNGSRTTNVWKFSATDQAVASQIEEAIMSGKEVALKYCEKQFSMGTTDTNYIITKVVIH